MLRRAPHGVLRAVDTELVAAYVVQAETLARAAKAAADMPLIGGDGNPILPAFASWDDR